MNFRVFAARCALAAACGLMAVTPASAHFWQCVTFARSVSGIDIHGNANTWWGKAAGHYQRGDTPKEGAVLAFAATGRMPMGHVAMVSKVVSDREVLLTHANWSRPGQVETNVRAVDVSPDNDWHCVTSMTASIASATATREPTSNSVTKRTLASVSTAMPVSAASEGVGDSR